MWWWGGYGECGGLSGGVRVSSGVYVDVGGCERVMRGGLSLSGVLGAFVTR